MCVSQFRPVPLRLSLSAVAALADAMARALHRPRRCGDRLALAFAFQLGPMGTICTVQRRSRELSKAPKIEP